MIRNRQNPFPHPSLKTGPGYSKLTTLLVKETLKFATYFMQKLCLFFCRKNVRSFCGAKVPFNFSAKNIAAVDYVSTKRHNISLIKEFSERKKNK